MSSGAAAGPHAEQRLLAGARTVGVVAGVLTFSDPSVAPFSDELRKDRELYDVLVERGVPPKNLTLLLDRRATVANIRDAVARTAERAEPDSTFLFYYAGHGARDDGGSAYFLGHDTRDADSGLGLAGLAELIATRFRGERVVLMGDCCYSGALQRAAERIAARGMKTVALTSADASNLSTGNWTFTQTVIDVLRGDWAADRDANGAITLGELGDEVGAAMKHREKQRHGFALGGVAASTLVSPASRPPRAVSNQPFSLGAYVSVAAAGVAETGRVRDQGDGDALVRLYHYNRAEDVRVPTGRLSALRFVRKPVGSAVEVYWGGKLWDAKVVRTDGDFHLITYPGWPSFWDEWVLSDRIAGAEVESKPSGQPLPPSGERVEVEWRGRWYEAVVLRRSGRRALIHYSGYDSSWDEWVGPERLRAVARP